MLCLQKISEYVNLDRCNTLIAACTGGLPRPQLAGRANSTTLASYRQQAGPKSCGSQSLRVAHMSANSACYVLDSKEMTVKPTSACRDIEYSFDAWIGVRALEFVGFVFYLAGVAPALNLVYCNKT
eukprot:946230-Amphidinium_carterae.1